MNSLKHITVRKQLLHGRWYFEISFYTPLFLRAVNVLQHDEEQNKK